MADQVLKTVRITDNIKVEVLQQGKKRKYALFYDGDTEFITSRGRGYEETDKNNNTKSEKYDIAMSDDDVIEMALKAYNSRFGSPQKKWYITQKVYSDPAPARTYGNGDKSPYYLNNGCAINIQWVGKIPNPEFNPGTYSNLNDAEKAGKRAGKPRYLENSTITSTTDNANNSDILPKSSWSVSPPVIFDDDLFGNSGTGTLVNAGQEVPVDYRDTSYVQNKIVTVTLPKGFTENGGKGYLVWTEGDLEYDSKSIPENTPTKMAYVDGVYRDVGYRKPKNQIRYFEGHRSDAYVIEQVINVFLSKVLSLHNDLPFPYDLKLCAPDNETCSLIPYKSPLESPNNTPQQAAINDIPPPVPIQSGKLKLSIQGLFENEDGTTPGSTASVFEIKAKTNMPAFIVRSGEIPKTEEIDQFENLPELDEEYSETGFGSVEEQQLVFESDQVSLLTEGAEPLNVESQKESEIIESTPYVPSGKHNLDLIPKTYRTNSGQKIQLCCINGKPVNVKIADALLDMIAAAKKDDVIIFVKSGFRSPEDPINTKSSKGFVVSAQSQRSLWNLFKAGKGNIAAEPGKSNHGNGIALDLNPGGKSSGRKIGVDRKIYTWLVKNSWKFGFIRTVPKEEWHFDYVPEKAKKGPYGAIPGPDLGRVDTKFYKDWGLDNLSISNL